jgi:predicted nucleic acid-binding protein
MSIFVDTNILLRSVQSGHPLQDVAVKTTSALLASGETLVITPQVIAEFWNVVTRPLERNGFGLSVEQAQAELQQIESFFTVVGETWEVYEEWKRIVAFYRVSGVQVHDARLVAAMSVHGIDKILTFDAGDFTRFTRISAIRPDVRP